MYELTIDEELEHLLPPLSEEEFANLERDIIANGVREAIIVWAGHNTVIDGHNRYRICKEHGIPYAVFEMSFPDKTAAANWIVKNQKTRRNMTKGQEADVGIRLYKIQFEEEARARQGTRTDLAVMREHSDQLVGMSGAPNSETVLTNIASDSNPATEQHKAQKDEDFATHETPELPQPTQQKSPYEADVPIEVVRVPEKNRENETAYRIAEKTGVGVGTVKRVMAVHESGEQDLIDGIQSGEMSANKAYTEMRERKKPKPVPVTEPESGKASLYPTAYANETVMCDLLATEAPDDTDWLYSALNGVSHDGFAYVFVSPEPSVLSAYLSADIPPNVELSQVLVWSFDYMLGNADREHYKPSWKAILFYRGIDAGSLDFPHIEHRSSVQVVNAESDGLGSAGYELRMPIDLARRLILQSTKEGDLVFDPFAHQGAFLAAASMSGRDAIGYEGDHDRIEKARKRGIDVEEPSHA